MAAFIFPTDSDDLQAFGYIYSIKTIPLKIQRVLTPTL